MHHEGRDSILRGTADREKNQETSWKRNRSGSAEYTYLDPLMKVGQQICKGKKRSGKEEKARPYF